MIALQSSGYWFTLWPLLFGISAILNVVLARALWRATRRRPII